MTRIRHGCEICGNTVRKPILATTCHHMVYLCEDCQRTCPGATRLCIKCEELGVNPEPKA